MSLDWRVGEIKDYKSVCWKENPETGEEYLNPITQSLIYSTLSIGIAEITEDNVIDFYNRSILTADVYGQPINEFPEEGGIIRRNYTLEEIQQHIGLSTNASDYSDKQFMDKIRQAQIRKQKDLESIRKYEKRERV